MMQMMEGKVTLTPLLVPNNLKAQMKGTCRFVARLQARSEEVGSDVFANSCSLGRSMGGRGYGDAEASCNGAGRLIASPLDVVVRCQPIVACSAIGLDGRIYSTDAKQQVSLPGRGSAVWAASHPCPPFSLPTARRVFRDRCAFQSCRGCQMRVELHSRRRHLRYGLR